jgi:diketogulonate reductase-like aldo/keto reductase
MIRREALNALAAGAATLAFGRRAVQSQSAAPLLKPVPSSGERIPAVGLGTWITFNVGNDRQLREECVAVMRAFFAAGGRMIDSSPMYGSSQDTIGFGLQQVGRPAALLSAEKVWISSGSRGPAQIEASRAKWGVQRFDLLQVHNLLAWEEHLPALFAMKSAGRLRYVGITTSEGRRHDDIERVMRAHPLDFVQVTYNIRSRQVEERILPLARDRGIAVICNRPFEQGTLVRQLERQQLPAMAREIGAKTWAQFILKYIVSHPAVTCAIPATSQVAHVRENLEAATGTMPDPAFRERMARYVASL